MGNGKLQYEKEILGNNRDDRYEERGNMPYKELYLDNLPNRSKEIIISNVKNETVSLFKRLSYLLLILTNQMFQNFLLLRKILFF